MINKRFVNYLIVLGISILFYFLNVSIQWWFLLMISFFCLLLENFRKQINNGEVPFGTLISIIFFIENIFALILLTILPDSSPQIGSINYLFVPLFEYLFFGFISAQLFNLGTLMVVSHKKIWFNVVNDFSVNFTKKQIVIIFFIGVFGSSISLLEINSLNFVSQIFSSFTLCSLIGFYLLGNNKSNRIYLILGLLLAFITALRSGMFTSLMINGIVFFCTLQC